MDPTAKLPGVTFHIQHSALRDKAGSVTLDATVEDIDLWEKVLKKLEGFRVYTVADLQTAMVECMQEENRDEKTAHVREVSMLREELERSKQELSLLKSRQEAMDEERKRFKQFEEELSKLARHGVKVE